MNNKSSLAKLKKNAIVEDSQVGSEELLKLSSEELLKLSYEELLKLSSEELLKKGFIKMKNGELITWKPVDYYKSPLDFLSANLNQINLNPVYQPITLEEEIAHNIREWTAAAAAAASTNK